MSCNEAHTEVFVVRNATSNNVLALFDQLDVEISNDLLIVSFKSCKCAPT
jgi:hypothetical protein